MEKDQTPFIPDRDFISQIEEDRTLDLEMRIEWAESFGRINKGEIFIREIKKPPYLNETICNVWLSQCYSCNKFSIWLNGKIIYPFSRDGEEPNEDLDEEVRLDYEEARAVLDFSPRSSAALLRLCIQKICQKFGGEGTNLNQDIATLVSNGLDIRIQQALDIVRVIGNNSVHPGQIDLRDDRKTATQLFRLVNLIAEKLISEPKHIQAMFDALPENARAQIAKRNNGR